MNWQAKFCLDRNSVRWVLLEGVITRTAQNDDPTAGQTLPVSRITRIDRTSVERVRRSAVARPAIYTGLFLLALFGWLATSYLMWALPGLAIGVVALLWGLLRLPGHREKLDSFQIVASGVNALDWVVLGSHHEVIGFIEGVQADMHEIEKAAASSKK